MKSFLNISTKCDVTSTSGVAYLSPPLRQKCPYRSCSSPHFPAFGLNTPYLIRMRENTDPNNSEYGHFSHSAHVH